ncbi:MAG: hypothetical protein M1136_05010 [Chloroflexi bacterium]|nr:hypothetical protein [Chloroflexota bacterium]MCL5074997.1 hypothetical protein [Chloroflexota bacterium]
MPNAPSPSCVRPSTGNRTLLILADSSQAEALHLPGALYAALGHWGMPYQVLDLARSRFDAQGLASHAAVVIAQEHLGARLTSGEVAALLSAVDDGLGLVNFDHDLDLYGAAYREAVGLMGTGLGGRPAVEGVEKIVVADDGHYISYTREVGTAVSLRQPVPALIVRVEGTRRRVLAESQDGAPMLVAATLGQGKVVQWLLSPRVWTRSYLGHTRGMDDLFWKGITWAARKPFVMKAMPPFVRLRFDDCNGYWRDGSDFYFVDVLNAYGHIPSLALCMRAVTADGAARIRALADAGRAEFAPHILEPSKGIFYGDEAGEYSEEQFHAIIAEVKELFQKWGVRISPILSDHDHTWSWGVVPLLRELGIEFKMNITLPGERWEDVHVDWRPAPYGVMDYALDYLPDPLSHLFVVFNHYPAFEHARAYLPDGRFTYNRAGGFGSYKWDFLNGLTTYRGQQATNQVEVAARRLAEHTRLGLDSLFFGGSISHSHFIRDLSAGEWRALMDRYEELTARYQKLNVGYDQVAHYARSKVDSHLAYVEAESSGTFHCRLEGRTTVPLQLYVFRDVDDGTEHRFQEVPVFEGRQEVSFRA